MIFRKSFRNLINWQIPHAKHFHKITPATYLDADRHNYPGYTQHLQNLISRQCNLSRTKHVGDLYEYAVIDTLNRNPFAHVFKTGGTGDKGFDFRGLFRFSSVLELPTNTKKRGRPKKIVLKELNVIGQCKCKASKIGPADINSFIGAVSVTKYPQNTVAIFVSSLGITKAAMENIWAVHTPIINVVMKPPELLESEGERGIEKVKFYPISSILPNQKARELLNAYDLEIVNVHLINTPFSIFKLIET